MAVAISRQAWASSRYSSTSFTAFPRGNILIVAVTGVYVIVRAKWPRRSASLVTLVTDAKV
jgi:hypothetical protein